MVGTVVKFVVFDYYQAGDEGEECCAVQEGVDGCALVFLLRGVGWLEDKDCLGG